VNLSISDTLNKKQIKMTTKEKVQLDIDFNKLLVKLNCQNLIKLIFSDIEESEVHFHKIKYPHLHKFCE